MSAMYDAPMLAIREGRGIHLADRTAVREHLTELMAAYARSGAARADIAALDVVAFGQVERVCHGALARARYQRRPTKGLPHDVHLLREDGDWRILSYTSHDD